MDIGADHKGDVLVDKKSDYELLVALGECPDAGTGWVHYKTGNLYWVHCAAICEATQEPMVVYHQQYSPIMFTRPLREWEQMVDHNGRKVARFTPIRMKK